MQVGGYSVDMPTTKIVTRTGVVHYGAKVGPYTGMPNCGPRGRHTVAAPTDLAVTCRSCIKQTALNAARNAN